MCSLIRAKLLTLMISTFPHILECNPFQTQLLNNNFHIKINDLSLKNDVWSIETSIETS